jgi:NAD(P)-dependent dehydrogenase (short-subunit alcohol dehydrogenase family)
MSAGWTAADIPDQTGRAAVVTGANSGLGRVTALELARRGARVVLACRDVSKGEEAAAEILGAVPEAAAEILGAVPEAAAEILGAVPEAPAVSVSALDLADLSSVRAFAARVAGEFDRVDLLINNAGVMAPPRRLTADGFESQLGTNHLGHFALTGLLLASLLAAPAPRVVTVSSQGHRLGRIKFDDLQGERRYNNWVAYNQSKLANLMFSFELQARAVAAGAGMLSMAAHPGYAATNLQFAGPGRAYERAVMTVANRVIAQSASMGALPTLYAATLPELPGGSYVGPGGIGEWRGSPRVVGAARRAYDENACRRLWEVSEHLTGVRYEFPV